MRVRLDTREVKSCAKCTNPPPYYRHHKGADGLIGKFNKSVKKGYFKFYYSVRLCDNCHMTIHYIYGPYIKAHTKWTAKGVLKLRAKLIRVCNDWLKGKIPTPVVPPDFRAQWQTSYKAWQGRQELHQQRMEDQEAKARARLEAKNKPKVELVYP